MRYYHLCLLFALGCSPSHDIIREEYLNDIKQARSEYEKEAKLYLDMSDMLYFRDIDSATKQETINSKITVLEQKIELLQSKLKVGIPLVSPDWVEMNKELDQLLANKTRLDDEITGSKIATLKQKMELLQSKLKIIAQQDLVKMNKELDQLHAEEMRLDSERSTILTDIEQYKQGPLYRQQIKVDEAKAKLDALIGLTS